MDRREFVKSTVLAGGARRKVSGWTLVDVRG